MKSARLDDMIKGWFVGDFEPNVLRTKEIEVAVKRYTAGESEELHHHRIATEITVVISGEVHMCGKSWGPGDIIVLEPGDATAFEAPGEAVIAVVKLPSAKNDKYLGEHPSTSA